MKCKIKIKPKPKQGQLIDTGPSAVEIIKQALWLLGAMGTCAVEPRDLEIWKAEAKQYLSQ